MTIRFKCEECGSVLKIKDELAGTDGKCPKCKTKFVVPAAPEQNNGADDSVSDLEQTPPKSDSTTKAATAAKKSSKPAKPAAAEDDDFDPMAVLMDESDPKSRSSAGLAAPPPEPAAPQRPAVDKSGRRHIVPPPPSPSATTEAEPPNGGAVNASANARDLLTKTMSESKSKAAAMPEDPKEKAPRFNVKEIFEQSKGELGKLAAYVGGGILAIALLYWVSSSMFGESIPLPELAPVSGTVTVGGQPLPNVTVILTPVETTGKSTEGKDLRLRDAMGATDENGYYEVGYMQGVSGAPVGKVRIWLQPNSPQDYAKVPGKYLEPSTDIREVKEAGNEGGRFDLELEAP